MAKSEQSFAYTEVGGAIRRHRQGASEDEIRSGETVRDHGNRINLNGYAMTDAELCKLDANCRSKFGKSLKSLLAEHVIKLAKEFGIETSGKKGSRKSKGAIGKTIA